MKTAEEEYEAFYLIKKIVGERISPERLTKSEAKTYLGVLLDNSSHKTICRLYLLGRRKYIGTISSRKVETKTQITSLSDITRFSKQLQDIISHYDNKS
jgi:predicted type IV restriction endonuclease